MKGTSRITQLASVWADVDATLRPDNYDVVAAFNKQFAMREVTEADRTEFARVYRARFEKAVRP